MARYDSQEDARASMTKYDQWGRPWVTTVEKETMTACAPITPQFKAPVIPDGKYIRDHGRENPVRITIDLDRWETDLAEKHDSIRRRIQKIMEQHYPQWKAKYLPAAVIDKIYGEGRPPMPLDVIWAMRQGNRWVLGFSENRPDWSREGEIGEFFDPPLTEREQRKAERVYEDVDEEGQPIEGEWALSDENEAPRRPTTLAGVPEGVAVGFPGDRQSWGNVERNRTVREVESFTQR